MSFRIRDAAPGDETVVAELILALAVYEKMADRCQATPELMRAALFGAAPSCECVLAELDTGRIAGFALFHGTFSTFLAKPGLWLEDLFVHADLRGMGIGKALIGHGAKLCVARGLGATSGRCSTGTRRRSPSTSRWAPTRRRAGTRCAWTGRKTRGPRRGDVDWDACPRPPRSCWPFPWRSIRSQASGPRVIFPSPSIRRATPPSRWPAERRSPARCAAGSTRR
jgi:GNAT superfamily N-acetyltransferase